MTQINVVINRVQGIRTFFYNNFIAPIMEEGLLIGIAIVAILIVLGIIFGVFDWIGDNLRSLFDTF